MHIPQLNQFLFVILMFICCKEIQHISGTISVSSRAREEAPDPCPSPETGLMIHNKAVMLIGLVSRFAQSGGPLR